MEHDETGCQPPPEGPILCVNNCGFFGSPASMNMCSKCYKDTILKQEQAKGVSSSIINAGPLSSPILQIPKAEIILKPSPIEANKMKGGPNRCATCKTRVGLTGFECKCGNLFCGAHRYSDKHECPFDYHAAGKDAIERANPVVKAEKLEKI